MLLKSPPLQNELFHQPSSIAPSSGPGKNKSVSPLLASLLHREAQKGKPMSPPPWRSGLALNPGSAPPPTLPEAESPLHRSLHHWEADKWGHLPPSTPSPISYSPCIPHLTSQALLSFSPRHRRTISTTSFRSSRGTLHLPSTRDLGLPLTGQPLEISDWLGGLQARGKILGAWDDFSGSLSFQRFPSQPPRPARTQRPWPAPSPSWGVRSHPGGRGTVRESQSPQSPPTTHNRSNSPDY